MYYYKQKINAMKKELRPLHKIGIIAVLVIVLPILLFSIYEFSSLRHNEKIVETIYNNQLDAILFSINQYSSDVVESLCEKFSRFAYTDTVTFQQEKDIFFSENPFCKYVSITQGVQGEGLQLHSPAGKNSNKQISLEIKRIIEQNRKKIKRLATYLRGGYRKIEGFELQSDTSLTLFLFLHQSEKEDFKILGILIDGSGFTKQILAPKIEAIAQNKFYIAITDSVSGQQICSSTSIEFKQNQLYQKSLWLLPEYKVGIQLLGNTIDLLIKKRLFLNIGLLIIVDIFLITGIFLIYRNVKKEMQLAQIKSEFVSNVSHEIRTPLSLINMYVETLEMNRIKDEKKRKEYYQIISQETKRLSGIVNKILNFSQIESGKRKYQFVPINLNQVVDEILNTCQNHLQGKNFTVHLVKNKNIPEIKADKEALNDLIINLLDNAIKYSKTEKYIEIRTGIVKKHVFFQICDKGIGMEQKHLQFIFDKFYRITGGSLAHHAKGSGLGLTIVKHIVDLHNAQITVESEKGEGSCFSVMFPLAKNIKT